MSAPHDAPRPASGTRRVLAYLIDWCLLSIPIGWVTGALLHRVDAALDATGREAVFTAEGELVLGMQALPVAALIGVALFYLYKTLAEAATGRTLGKTVLGTRVVRAGGAAMDLRVAARRNRWLLLGLIPGLGGPLVTLVGIVIATRARRAEPVFHDRAAGTRVLRG